MSKVLLDHVPARTPSERHAAPGPPATPDRSKLEAGILGLVLIGILVFAAGFAAVFPESAGSPAFWPTYRDPAGVFELRYPRGWEVEETAAGVRLSDGAMTVDVTVRTIEDTSVDRLAAERIAEVGDVGAAEAVPLDGTSMDGRPAAAIQELATGDGRVMVRWYVQADAETYVTIVATAPPERFDQAAFDDIADTMRILGPDVSQVEDRMGQSRP